MDLALLCGLRLRVVRRNSDPVAREPPFSEIGQVTVGRSAEKRRVPGNVGLDVDDGDYCVYTAGLHGRSFSQVDPKFIDSPLGAGQRHR